MAEVGYFARRASGLVRELSWLDVAIIAAGAPAASGIMFFSVAAAHRYPGGSIWLAFLIGTLLLLPVAILLGIATATVPRSGSPYTVTSRVLDPSVAYIGAILFFFGYGVALGVIGYIVAGIAGGVFSVVGQVGNQPGLKDFGSSLGSTNGQIIGGLVFTVIAWLLVYLGTKSFKISYWVLFLIPFVATLVAIVYFLAQGSGGGASSFNATWGTGAFQKVIDAATAEGWTAPAFSFTETLRALVVVFWAFAAFEVIGFAAGEVKNPRVNLLKGFIIGLSLVGVLYMIVSFAAHFPFGQFVPAYGYLQANNPDALAAIMPAISPSVPFYAASLMPLWLGLTVGLALTLWFINSLLPVILGASRLAFGLAMDRAWPSFMAGVSEKRGSPTWALHITALLMVVGVFIMQRGVGEVLSLLTFLFYFWMWPFGLGMALLPYKRPDIYELSPVKWECWGIPWVSILGVITCLVGMFILVVAALTDFTIAAALTLVVVIGLGLILYIYQAHRLKKQGVELGQVYGNIPPE